MYVDKLDVKIIEKFYENKLVEWQTEMSNISDQTERHKNADISYLSQGIHILELVNKAHALYLKQNHSEKRKLLNDLLSNCTMDGVNLYTPIYRKPFGMIAKGLEIDKLPLLDAFRTFKEDIVIDNIKIPLFSLK